MDERLSDESMRITSALLDDVRRGLARGVDPGGEEPDEHKAVRTIEAEAIRARASEAALVAEVRRLRNEIAAVPVGVVIAAGSNPPGKQQDYLLFVNQTIKKILSIAEVAS